MFDVNWSRRIKITVNGKEYARMEDVPEEFRTLFKDRFGAGIPHASPHVKRTWSFAGFVNVTGMGEPLDALGVGPIALPDGFQLDDDGLERRISWRLFSWYAMRGILFAAIFSVPFAFMLYAYVNSSNKSWSAPVLAIAVSLTLPGTAVMYGWLAYLINRTTVIVDRARISVRHGPLPWLGARNVAREDIQGIVSERVINDSADSSDGTIFQPRVIYRVKLVLKNGKTRKLVTNLRTPEQAFFIEQQIRQTCPLPTGVGGRRPSEGYHR